MKKLLSLGTVALVALAMGVSANAAPTNPYAYTLERKAEWQAKRIRQLEDRREYLHRYIRHLRKTTTPIVRQAAPSTPATTTTTSSGGWADELRAAGFPESAIPHMLYIIQRESGGNPSAINPSSQACGLTQIYPYVPGCLDPMTNLRLAFQKYQASGFAPWGG